MDSSPASLDALLNAALLHFLESHTDVRFRHGVAAGLASAINALIERAPPQAGSPATAHARRLADEGYAPLGEVLTAGQAAEIVAYFTARPCFNSAMTTMSDRVPRRVGDGAERFAHGSYALADVIAAPFLLELVNRPDIVAVAEAYLGCTPTLYALHAAWSFSRPETAEPPPLFRRDRDDYKFCTLFIHLTDVGTDNGPQAFVRRSHRVDLVEAIVRHAAGRATGAGRPLAVDDLYQTAESEAQDRLYAEIFQGLVDVITGPAGSAFIADTGGLHKALPVSAGRRLIASARYGLYRNTHAALMGEAAVAPSQIAARLPRDLRTMYINRCLIRDPSPAAQEGAQT